VTEKGPLGKEHRDTLIRHWMGKARESMDAAQSEYDSERYATAVRDLYYACFYALTAALLKQERSFKKHTAVKAALHKDLIRAGIVESKWGKFYNKIFYSRHEGDYQPLRVFEAEEVKMLLDQGAGFIKIMETLLAE